MNTDRLLEEDSNSRECETCGSSQTVTIPASLNSVRLALAERLRQIDELGYDAEHDSHHSWTDLAQAGACYAEYISSAYSGDLDEVTLVEVHPYWPFDNASWNFSSDDPKRQLVKAAALILAAIDALESANPYITNSSSEKKG